MLGLCAFRFELSGDFLVRFTSEDDLLHIANRHQRDSKGPKATDGGVVELGARENGLDEHDESPTRRITRLRQPPRQER